MAIFAQEKKSRGTQPAESIEALIYLFEEGEKERENILFMSHEDLAKEICSHPDCTIEHLVRLVNVYNGALWRDLLCRASEPLLRQLSRNKGVNRADWVEKVVNLIINN